MQRIVSLMKSASCLGSYLPTSTISSLPSIFSSFQNTRQLLAPSTTLINQVCGFKVKGRVRRRCEACYFVVRDGRMYVICPKHPRHKQMAMRPKPHNTWILTHASQSRVRPW
ncbi:39S ribosomal protein L36, mitochondrial [Pectinophora gossypiella]|uniref:39S ribosomal protein L36, mitochondrial n=1 Tax=Pectinophora gossypiella TaxID=13191 RepID=UPI00214F407E|nr:39S ribosomal protein L36, mitochondrial [Pectinophora gossypiella]